VRGPEIITRTLSQPLVSDKSGRMWQYHSRSDQHSKVACWAILFDLLQTSSLLQAHVASGKVAFGINRRINDWHTGRKKDLDLVVSRSGSRDDALEAFDLIELGERYRLDLTEEDREALRRLPTAPDGAAGSTVLVALEAKACMTAHVRALPRLYDELTSSHATVHGDNDNALAVGFVMINIAETFISPGRQDAAVPSLVVNMHRQPHDTERTLAKVREINRRPGPRSAQAGFDALGVMVVDMPNDGSPVSLMSESPAPQPADDFFYDRMVVRAAHLYDASFGHV
jgi:hypothetical protein